MNTLIVQCEIVRCGFCWFIGYTFPACGRPIVHNTIRIHKAFVTLFAFDRSFSSFVFFLFLFCGMDTRSRSWVLAIFHVLSYPHNTVIHIVGYVQCSIAVCSFRKASTFNNKRKLNENQLQFYSFRIVLLLLLLLLFLHSRHWLMQTTNRQRMCHAANADKSHELISPKWNLCGPQIGIRLTVPTTGHGPIANTIAFSFERSIFNAIKTIRIDTFSPFSALTSIGSINFASAWSHFCQQYYIGTFINDASISRSLCAVQISDDFVWTKFDKHRARAAQSGQHRQPPNEK